jgi:hypothetical protein
MATLISGGTFPIAAIIIANQGYNYYANKNLMEGLIAFAELISLYAIYKV